MARNQDVDDDEFAGLGGDSGSDVDTQTGKLLDVPKQDPGIVFDSVVALAGSLPRLEDVAEVEEGDVSPLSDMEKQQKEETETVILAASKVGKAAIWVRKNRKGRTGSTIVEFVGPKMQFMDTRD